MFDLFNNNFMPHGQCFYWRPGLLWTHVLADGLIFLSYFSIAIALAYLLARRRTLTGDTFEFQRVANLFSTFIMLCGLSHLVAIVVLWNPVYVLEGWVKVMTAAVSMITALALLPLIPRALSIKSPAQLQREVEARMQAERQLARTVIQLRQSNADLEQFAYVASHDLRAPLRSIASFAKLARSKSGRNIDPEVDEYLNYVAHGAYRMQSMIDDLLELSRVESEARTTVSVDLMEVQAEARSQLDSLIKETQARIEVDPLPSVTGDRTQLVQLFQNLLSNAIKFQPPGRHPSIRISARVELDRVVVSIQDNGIGIAAHHSEKIFKLFSRLHGDGAYPGTGMGLAICKKIVERHGGRIAVESVPGEGSTFHFDLAAAQAAIERVSTTA